MLALINSKGYTLVELLIALGVIAALTVTTTTLLWDMVTVQSRQAAASTGSNQAQAHGPYAIPTRSNCPDCFGSKCRNTYAPG
jgi:prepilin-type N-terminal cleavage/methylation domain-containing protein